MLCFKCYTFGHTKLRCQQLTSTCGHCAQKHAIVENSPCTATALCPRCLTNLHSTSSRNCPVYQQEDAIQRIRVDKGISYPAARRIFETATGNKSFAGVTKDSKDKTTQTLESRLEQVIKKLVSKDRKINALEETLKTSPEANDSDVQTLVEFRLAITELHEELQRKDERIKSLENTLTGQATQKRCGF
ncbi:uncharacterized protein LOC129716632 [Wyeomyia smithii]|uniref:uncharacterized protein LOC129716632 n=1 Tax=Wyeomyia smithii TaxID=174621 RepID=UPI002467F794|nr:uncharacterized protein LOC129716632 [Wyeomyia smithii]